MAAVINSRLQFVDHLLSRCIGARSQPDQNLHCLLTN